MSKMPAVPEGEYTYEYDLPVEYETPEDAKRRRKRNASRKHQVVESARVAGVPVHAVAREIDGDEFDPAEQASKALLVAEGDYSYEYDLPVEYETPEEANRRRKRNASRKHRVVESARVAGVPVYAVPLDTDGDEFDPANQISKTLTVAEGSSANGEAVEVPSQLQRESALVPPADFWDRVADRVADRLAARLGNLFRQAPPS